MKNARIVFILFFWVATLFLASCRQPDGLQSSLDEEIQSDTSVEWINPVDSIDSNGMNIYWKSDNLYFTADNNANISLYVGAAKDNNDKFMFDDRQEWMLIMETSFGDYPLFSRKYIQLGKVDYTVFNEYDGNEYNIFHVLVTVSDSAGYEIYDCIFDDEKKAFKVVLVYSAMNINPVGSSR